MSEPSSNGRRGYALWVLTAIFVTAGIGYGIWWAVHGRYHETTDDAYVAGNVVQVTSQVVGTVASIHVEDTDFVKAGTPLVKLDQADTILALEQAEADLVRGVRLFDGYMPHAKLCRWFANRGRQLRRRGELPFCPRHELCAVRVRRPYRLPDHLHDRR